jgi:magnesium-dependent phosphatase 1
MSTGPAASIDIAFSGLPIRIMSNCCEESAWLCSQKVPVVAWTVPDALLHADVRRSTIATQNNTKRRRNHFIPKRTTLAVRRLCKMSSSFQKHHPSTRGSNDSFITSTSENDDEAAQTPGPALSAALLSVSSSGCGLLHDLHQKELLPRLIVFDLDNTLWTPELYEFWNHKPIANKTIHLFPDALKILQSLHHFQQQQHPNGPMSLAIASRASEKDWAQELLRTFQVVPGAPLIQLFPHVRIQTGSKRRHFESLQRSTQIPFSEMLFLDDDEYLNLHEVSSMGVLCCHTPRGITEALFYGSLRKYAELKSGNGCSNQYDNSDDDAKDEDWMGYILNQQNLGLVTLPKGKRTRVKKQK